MEENKKPLTIMRAEFQTTLVKVINESGLPAFVISDILKDAKCVVDELAQKQYESDMAAYRSKIGNGDKEG